MEGKTPQQLAVLEPLVLFDHLALCHQLSATRASGLATLAAGMQAIAARYF